MDNIAEIFRADPNINVVEAMKKIDINEKGILFVVDSYGKLQGCVSDGDLRRWIIKTGDLQQEIGNIMNRSPKYVYERDCSYANNLMEEYLINVVPVVNDEYIFIDVIFRQAFVSPKKKRRCNILENVPVIIMAGGQGTRLYPYTKVLPKPLIPINGIPIVERIMNSFYECGSIKFYMTVNYKRSMIKAYFSEVAHPYEILFVEEEMPKGTAGSIRLIKEKFTQPVIVTNCDILIQASYEDIYNYHINSGNAMTIVTALKNIVIPYGVLHSKENGIVTFMEEKPNLSYFINTGFYIVNGELFEKIPIDGVFHMTDLANCVMKDGARIGIYPVSEDSFLDMGEFEEMHRMEEKLNIK